MDDDTREQATQRLVALCRELLPDDGEAESLTLEQLTALRMWLSFTRAFCMCAPDQGESLDHTQALLCTLPWMHTQLFHYPLQPSWWPSVGALPLSAHSATCP